MMNLHKIKALLLAGALMPAIAKAEDTPPPNPPNATVYVGSCISPALNGPSPTGDNDEAGFLAAVLGAAVPSLIGSGLDWIGTQLTALGADKKTTVFGSRATEATFDDRTCVSIVRFSNEGQRLDNLIASQPGWSAALTKPNGDTDWTKFSVPDDRPLDFLIEFWVRLSTGREVVSLVPTLLYYPRQMTDRRNGNRDAAVAITARFEPSGETAATWTWALPRQVPLAGLQVLIPPAVENGKVARHKMSALRQICETSCEMASSWTGNPWTKEAKGPAPGGSALANNVGPGGAVATSAQMATNVRIEVTEIRAGSAFFRALGAAFTATKPVFQTGLEQAVLPAKRAEAETTALTTKATALTVFSTKLDEADTAKNDKYCAAKGKAGANWTALSADLQAKQLLANVAADAAGVAHPFPTPILVTAAIESRICS